MSQKPAVALFATCLVDHLRPSVGFSAARLLERAGFEVQVPPAQTCCGQPGYNAGDRAPARLQAMRVIEMLEAYPQVVVPSGSCAAMLIHHYPRLLADDPGWLERAQRLAEKCRELSQFLVNCTQNADPNQDRGRGFSPGSTFFGTEVPPTAEVPPTTEVPPTANVPPTVAYHDACSGLRELGVGTQARALLNQRNLTVRELEHNTECCGFGGTFCVKYPQISARMADDKLEDLQRSGAETLCSGDLGCLLHLEGRARRRGLQLQFRHLAELLDGEH